MPRGHRPSPFRRTLRWLLPLVVLAVIVLGVVMGIQALSAYRHLKHAQAELTQMKGQMVSGDITGARQTLQSVRRDAGSAHGSLSGPHWAIASHLPFVGHDVSAVRTVADGVDQLADGALPELLTSAQLAYADAQSVHNGKIDLAPIRRAAPHLALARTVLDQVDADDATIDRSALSGQLREPVGRFIDTLAGLRRSTAAAADAARLLPPMLGDKGPRNYLVLAQNTAEQRSLGGETGTLLLVHADRGRIHLANTTSTSSFGSFPETVLPLSTPEISLYGQQFGQYMQEVTDSANFPRAAQLAKTMWQRKKGGRVDGVLAVDPYALQLILKATGPVQPPDGRAINGDNAARLLLNQVYFDYPNPPDQDAYFSRAASAVFDKVKAGAGNRQALLTALSTAVDQHRVLLWSSRSSEQQVFARAKLGATWPPPQSAGSSPNQVGVFLHDRTPSKMSWYQRVRVQTSSPCQSTGRTAHVKVTVRSVAPRRALPTYITGYGSRVPRGHMLTQVDVFAPPGWAIDSLKASDGDDSLTMVQIDRVAVGSRYLRLAPGQSRMLDFTLRRENGSAAPMSVRTTPGNLPDDVKIDRVRCS